MNKKRERDEHLERLWYMKEEGKDSLDALESMMAEGFNFDIFDELLAEDFVDLSEEGRKVVLTRRGDDYARRLIRAHRLAERLLCDILGGDYELGACEFEHTVTPELIDSICILLGHPRECPHGRPIPDGDCCRRSSTTAHGSITPLVELEVGQSALVAYVNCENEQQLHRMDGLRIRPGVIVTLHQKYPTYVIECEGSNMAMDEAIVANICVWREPQHL